MFHYKDTIEYKALPLLPMEELTVTVVDHCRRGWRMLAFFGLENEQGREIVCILGHAADKMLDAFRAPMPERYQSMTPNCPQDGLVGFPCSPRDSQDVFSAWDVPFYYNTAS